MKLIYIAHPIGGDVENNLKDLYRILRRINLEIPDVVACAPYVCDILALNDSDPYERARGISNDEERIKRTSYDEIWLTGERISSGMMQEAQLFKSLNIKVCCKIGEL